MPDAFLESSALIELVFRHREVQRRVENACPLGGRRLTSRYVLFEIARGYLLSLLVLQNKARAVGSLRELHEYMHSGQQRFKTYRRETMLGAYEDFLAHLKVLGISVTEEQGLPHFRGWLSQHLRHGWRRLTRVAETINPVGCREDIPAPAQKANGLYEQALPIQDCGLPQKCGLDRYLCAHHSDFKAGAEALAKLESPDAETERRVVALRRLLARKAGADFDGKDCWSSGDAIICHEAPTNATIVSKNRKHFEPLCAVFGRTLSTYV
jgi:hypothetical protein